MFRAVIVTLLLLQGATALSAQQTSQTIQLRPLLDQAESSASLTVNGSPFHAQLEIAGEKREPRYAGTVIVDWASPIQYRVEVRSSQFHEVQVVEGTQIQEQREGDFYPAWLHSFVDALLHPLFAKSLLLQHSASLRASRSTAEGITKTCIDRNDRPGGITDEMTWSGVCIDSKGALLHVHTFQSWMDYSDQREFNGKKIARKYSTSTGSYERITAHLTSLKPLDTSGTEAIHVTQATPASDRIGFAFISTQAEEARLESAKSFVWPSVREGRTDGFMIVDAITDTTGQVRETRKHNSDNAELEEAGRQAALGYKFKPMLLDGVPVEMEMPLVLHFTSTIADPYPVLRGADLLKQIHGCNTKLVASVPDGSKVTPTEVAISEDGKVLTEHFGPTVNYGTPAVVVTLETPSGLPVGLMQACRFTPLKRNGVPTQYHGDLLVVTSK